MINRSIIHRVSLVLILAVVPVGCSQSQDGVVTKTDATAETGIAQTADAASQPVTDPEWERDRLELTEYPESWLFLIKEVEVTRKSIMSARFSLKNLSDKVIISDRFALEASAAYSLRLWHRGTSGNFFCFYSNNNVWVNPARETTRIQPGEEVTLEFRFSDEPLLDFRFYREPEGGARDWAQVSPAMLEPGEYVVDSQLLVEFSTEDDIRTGRRVNLMSNNKVWVDVE